MNRIAAAMLVAFACATAAGAQHTRPKSSAAGQVAAFAETWNRHDMRSFGRLFAADADFVNVTGKWWKGRAAIEKNHAFLHGTIAATDTVGIASPANFGVFARSTITFDSTEVRMTRPDLAVAHVAWHLTGDSRTDVVRGGLLVFVLAHLPSGWQVIVAQNTERARPAGLPR
jgi:uncharacterized protein (TIGR02246 family)